MPLTNTELNFYDSNVLRLPGDKRKEYHQQVDRLVDELKKSIRDKTEIKITKVVKAGSFAKHTILRKTSSDPVDVDVVFYVADKDADEETLQSLTTRSSISWSKYIRTRKSRISNCSGKPQP